MDQLVLNFESHFSCFPAFPLFKCCSYYCTGVGVLLRASQMNAKRNATTERALSESIRQVEILRETIQRLEESLGPTRRRQTPRALPLLLL